MMKIKTTAILNADDLKTLRDAGLILERLKENGIITGIPTAHDLYNLGDADLYDDTKNLFNPINATLLENVKITGILRKE